MSPFSRNSHRSNNVISLLADAPRWSWSMCQNIKSDIPFLGNILFTHFFLFRSPLGAAKDLWQRERIWYKYPRFRQNYFSSPAKDSPIHNVWSSAGDDWIGISEVREPSRGSDVISLGKFVRFIAEVETWLGPAAKQFRCVLVLFRHWK